MITRPPRRALALTIALSHALTVAAALVAISFSPPSAAEKADRKQKATITSLDFEGDQGKGVYRLTRDVAIVQGTLRITADRADVRTTEDEQYYAILTAKPVCFRQRTDGGNWAQGVSDRVEYDSAKGIVELIGNAVLFVGDDETRANFIVYNTQANTFEARDSKDKKTTGKGVTFVLQPRDKEDTSAAPPAESTDGSKATAKPAGKPAAKTNVVQPNPPKRNEPAFSRCA